MGAGHDRNAAFLFDQRGCVRAGPLVAGDIDAVGRGRGIDDALGNGGDMSRRDVLELLEHHVFGVIGGDYTFGGYMLATRDALLLRDISSGVIKEPPPTPVSPRYIA